VWCGVASCRAVQCESILRQAAVVRRQQNPIVTQQPCLPVHSFYSHVRLPDNCHHNKNGQGTLLVSHTHKWHIVTEIQIAVHLICKFRLQSIHIQGISRAISTLNPTLSEYYDHCYTNERKLSNFFLVVKGPAADATDAPQP
jgi:hypothetical protein